MGISETSKARHLVEQYCVGNGLDLGSSGDPVVPTSLQVELPNPYCPLLGAQYPPQFRGDATNLYWFRDGVLDYVFSSHLLEDFADWVPILKEWSRVIKSGGYLIVLMPDKERWQKALANGQPPNLAHKHEGSIGELPEALKKVDTYETIMDRFIDDTDYGLVYVGRKR